MEEPLIVIGKMQVQILLASKSIGRITMIIEKKHPNDVIVFAGNGKFAFIKPWGSNYITVLRYGVFQNKFRANCIHALVADFHEMQEKLI